MMRFAEYFQLTYQRREALVRAYHVAIRIAGIMFIAYIIAAVLSSLMLSLVLRMALKPGTTKRAVASTQALAVTSKPNFRDLQKTILDRNLFNSEGKLPDEKAPSGDDGSGSRVFNANAPCQKPSLKIELLGTIYMGNSAESVATIKESGYSDADVYKTGDSIIGNDQARIYAIERNRVVINNNNNKECLELSTVPQIAGMTITAPETKPTPPPTDTQPPPSGDSGGDACSNVSLESSFVEKELGPGFATILTKARLVPNPVGGSINGFKIFAIDKESLFGKICLQKGDIITQVNDVSLQQPEQGFALYQAFQDDREVRIHILRDGSTPKTITVRIK